MRLPNNDQPSRRSNPNMVELETGRPNMNKSENGQEPITSPVDSGMSSVAPSPAPSQSQNGVLSPTTASSGPTSIAPNSPSSPSKQRNSDGSPGTPTSQKQTVIVSRRAVATPPPGPLIYTPKENEFGQNFKILPVSCQIRELQTIIRDKCVFNAYFIVNWALLSRKYMLSFFWLPFQEHLKKWLQILRRSFGMVQSNSWIFLLKIMFYEKILLNYQRICQPLQPFSLGFIIDSTCYRGFLKLTSISKPSDNDSHWINIRWSKIWAWKLWCQYCQVGCLSHICNVK